MDYCTRTDIESLFGIDNVKNWADLDSDQDPDKIAARIVKAIAYAQADLDSRLLGGPYVVPITTSHPLITELTATLAGAWLYSARGQLDAVSGDGTDRLATRRGEAVRTIKDILSGQRRLDLPRVGRGSEAPFAVPQDAPARPRHNAWLGMP